MILQEEITYWSVFFVSGFPITLKRIEKKKKKKKKKKDKAENGPV